MGYELGHVPAWFHSVSCRGIGVYDVLIGIRFIPPIIATVVVHQLFGVWYAVAAAVASAIVTAWCLFPWWRIHVTFVATERFARARHRRQECLACGTKLHGRSAEYCVECRHCSE